MLSLSQFFSIRANIMRLVDLVEPSSGKAYSSRVSTKISLRLIDWFVTNYAKTHNVVIHSPIASLPFNVYRQYRMQLKAYSKQQFDPFRRRDRILFHYGYDNIETTVGQLNFFRWMIENRILEYVEDHVDEIEEDMITNTQNRPAQDVDPPKNVHCPNNSSQDVFIDVAKTNSCRMSRVKGDCVVNFE